MARSHSLPATRSILYWRVNRSPGRACWLALSWILWGGGAAAAQLPPPPIAQRAEPRPAREAGAQPGILLLAIDDFTRTYLRLMFESFTSTVATASSAPVIYFESLDAPRFRQQQYLGDLREWLRRKYADKRIDLVVPIGEDALKFLAASHGEPWPAAQVLYLEAGSIGIDTQATLPQAGGLLLEDVFSAVMEVVRTIRPETKRVALLYGASAVDRSRWGLYAAKIAKMGLEPIEWAGLSATEIGAAVKHLPADAVVMVLSPAIDSGGRVLSPFQVCELITSTAAVPTFTLEALNLGCGTVGGLMRDWTVVGQLLGQEVLARLHQPSAAVVTIPITRFTTLAFDERQLDRWNLSGGRLPPGALVRFREPNLWRDRRPVVIAAIAVTLLQSLLIAGLVFEHRRRRRAEMDSRLHLSALSHMDRRAAMGELATSLAHELNQPLNAILQNAGVAQMLLDSAPVPAALGEMPEIISDIRRDDIRASEVIRRMRQLLEKGELDARPLDMDEVVAETVAIVRPDARLRGVSLETSLASGVRPVLGDRVHLQQVLLNLLMNAMDAVADMPPERRRVRVSTDMTDSAVRLAVTDTGTGIQAVQIAKIFEPFYTTKGDGRGMGMGLAIARSIVEAHEGQMAAENTGDGGATVWFSVPTCPTAGSEL